MTLTVEGHAGADRGDGAYDLVCAAVSMITQALAETLRRGSRRLRVRTTFQAEASEARMRIHTEPTGPRGQSGRRWRKGEMPEPVTAWYEMAVTGLKMLARDYPENVFVEEEK